MNYREIGELLMVKLQSEKVLSRLKMECRLYRDCSVTVFKAIRSKFVKG